MDIKIEAEEEQNGETDIEHYANEIQQQRRGSSFPSD